MDLIADMLLVSAALAAGFYCFILSRRLAKFNDLEVGVGGAVAVLSGQVDDLTRALKTAQTGASASEGRLEELTQRAEAAAKQLELLMASMHDLPEQTPMRAAPEPRPEPVAPTPPAPQPEAGPVFSRAARSAG